MAKKCGKIGKKMVKSGMMRKVEISHRTIIFITLLIGAIWFFLQIKDIIITLFISLIMMIVLNPFIKRLSKFKIPKALAILIAYLAIIGVIVFGLAGIIPPLVEQTSNFASKLPEYIENLRISSSYGEQISRQVLDQIGNLPGRIVGFASSVLSNIINIIAVLTFTFYLLLARDSFGKQLSYLVGEGRSRQIEEILNELEVRLGGWARGQAALMITVGVFNYVGLFLLGIPFALPLALLAGVFEALPYIGPIIGAIPAVIIGFGISPAMGLATVALAFLIQQIENYVLVPKIMEKSVGVSPLVTLVSLAIGLKIAGITGVLLSIPTVIILQVLVRKSSYLK